VTLRVIEEHTGKWYVEGSSEEFPNHIEAIRRAKQLGKVKSKGNGRRFVSQKLQMTFRSNWEIELAEIMTELGIAFEYEPKRFYFRKEHESYLPDFFLPDYNCWIEVKGYMDKRSLRRCKLFKQYFRGKVAFFLFEKEERELTLKSPALLFTYIEAAQEGLRREKNK